MRKSMKKVVASIVAGTMAMAFAFGVVPSVASAGVQCSKEGEEAGKAAFNPDGEYHAYFLFQQKDSWIFRNSWSEPTLGLNGTEFEEGQSFDKILMSNDSGPKFLDGTITDAVIDGNGTYTVKVEGMDVSYLDQDASKVTMFGVSTDIPVAAVDDGTVKISDVSWAIDGTKKGSVEPYINADAKEWGLLEFDVVNEYQSDGYTSASMMLPFNGDMSITFTVSGMSKDSETAKAAAEEEKKDAAPSSADTDTDDDSSESGISTPAAIGIVVAAVVVIAGVVVVVTKKKKK